MPPVTNQMLNARREPQCSNVTAERKYYHVDGVTMAELTPEQRAIVAKEVEGHLETLRGLASDTWGGPDGLRPVKDLVFCHGDLSAHNVIVDPETLKVKAIIDWEHAGFYPKEFEGLYFYRPGPSAALDGEVDDVQALLDILRENSE
ncbi:Aminoglycoside phosphotransferase [Cordyceps fumosorosea ARSEF 2679]|uniref:Aminoglycoside phosphotransferase n=1 Tax=Cordyceps fumosorosea (strain ARSEF 2679) TaxID=1081104 RepID=A0A167XH38_CORFA|nr:Aminoglycoside phosphotransferase [Cordyceps fumosorosea ARSEF 2679]OAA64973.1 Aminoglycoside phosphotransferase [Cordyceps fumosorosea ARSEF 2679]